MKKFLFILFFLIFSSSALADKWNKFFENESITVYYDKQSIIKSDTKIDILLLFDFKKPFDLNEGPANSMIVYKVFDCKNRKHASLNTGYFKKKMGKGKPFLNIQKDEWKPVLEDNKTLNGGAFERLCA